MKKWLKGFLWLTLLILASASFHSVKAATKETVVVATDSSTAPFTYKKGGTFKGYDIDVLKAIFKGSKKYKVSFKTVAFPSILTGIDAGRYQIAANDFNYNEERSEKYIFSDAISRSNYAIASKKGTSYDSLDEVAGKSVEVLSGSNYAQVLENWNADNPDKAQIDIHYIGDSSGDVAQRLKDVESGKIDFVLYDAISMAYTAKDQGIDVSVTSLKDSLGSEKDGLEYFLFAKDSQGKTLSKFVNKRIKALKKDGTLQKLSQKYFGGDYVSSIE